MCSLRKVRDFSAPLAYYNARVDIEDHFAFRSIQTDPSDAHIVSSDAPVIGNMHVCFGVSPDPATLSFHAEGTLSSVPFVGKGECLTVRRDFPERGITVMRCFLDLHAIAVLAGTTGLGNLAYFLIARRLD
jgi:hypothetical protein